jgi:hypothetical protein
VRHCAVGREAKNSEPKNGVHANDREINLQWRGLHGEKKRAWQEVYCSCDCGESRGQHLRPHGGKFSDEQLDGPLILKLIPDRGGCGWHTRHYGGSTSELPRPHFFRIGKPPGCITFSAVMLVWTQVRLEAGVHLQGLDQSVRVPETCAILLLST